MAANGVERRVSKRYRVQLSIDISVKSLGSQRAFSYKTANLSKGGVYVVADGSNPFSEQSMLDVTLTLDPEGNAEASVKITFIGKVIHMRDKSGFGLKIAQISGEDRARYEEFIDQQVQAQAQKD